MNVNTQEGWNITWDIHYDEEDIHVIYKSPDVNSVKDAEFILIGEDHSRSSARYDHSLLINHHVQSGSVLLVEGCSALIEVGEKDKQKISTILQISKYAQSKLRIIGWDRFNHLVDSELDPMHDEKDPIYVAKYDKESNDFSLIKDYERTFLGKKMAFKACKHRLPVEFQKVAEEIIQDLHLSNREEIDTTFPSRTATMVHTLKVIEEQKLQGKIKGKVFLIAGLNHLENSEPTNALRSLDLLYEQLKHISAVVLTSKTTFRQRTWLEKIADTV